MIMKSCLLAIIAGCLAISCLAQVQPDVKDIEYARVDGASLKLDLYFPGIARPPYPLVVWVHGGGWRAGNKAPLPPHTATLLKRGYAVASINYRLSGQATWPAQIHDCKGALRWLRAHAQEYNLDSRRVGVWGSSAGGHLVAMLGTSMNVESLEGTVGGNLAYSSDVEAVCDWYGPSDLLTMGGWHDNPDSPEAKLIGGPVQENRGKAWGASPVAYVDGDEPPFLIMHGTKDNTVPFSQSEELRDSLLQHGVDVIFHPVEGAGHGGKLFRTDSVLRLIHAFFDRHLKGVVNSVERDRQVADGFRLYQNYPNPFLDNIVISWSQRAQKASRVVIYNILFRQLRTLKINARRGRNSITWDGKNDDGIPVEPGVYFYKVTSGRNSVVGRMVKLGRP